jgi:hypothetical protein
MEPKIDFCPLRQHNCNKEDSISFEPFAALNPKTENVNQYWAIVRFSDNLLGIITRKVEQQQETHGHSTAQDCTTCTNKALNNFVSNVKTKLSETGEEFHPQQLYLLDFENLFDDWIKSCVTKITFYGFVNPHCPDIGAHFEDVLDLEEFNNCPLYRGAFKNYVLHEGTQIYTLKLSYPMETTFYEVKTITSITTHEIYEWIIRSYESIFQDITLWGVDDEIEFRDLFIKSISIDMESKMINPIVSS